MVPLRTIGWSVAGCATVLVAGELTYTYEHGAAASIPLYMLLTFVVAWQAGFRASVPVALASTLGLDFFFTEPRFTFRVASPQDVFTLASYAGVSLLVSHLSNRIRLHADQLRKAEADQRALYTLSQRLLLLDWNKQDGSELCQICRETFRLNGVAVWLDSQPDVVGVGDIQDAGVSLEACFRAKQSIDLPTRAEHVRILSFGSREMGALGIYGAIEALTVDAISTLFATHLERTRALRAEVTAASQMVSERLRTAVLDGLAHAVKTPLTTIIASSSGLQELGELSSLQRELAGVIQNQATHLATLTDRLLRTAKLEDGIAILTLRPTLISAVVHDALDELRTEADMDRVNVTLERLSESFQLDERLMQMALVQLLSNALKYSPGGSPVTLHASVNGSSMEIAVHNQGTYISPAERTLVFERYYRSSSVEHSAPGTGIGLSVVKQAIEAHRGRIWIESDQMHGTTFRISIPAQETHA
jgi:two-component system sensor histidine kinase KdpD